MRFEITSDDGFSVEADSIEGKNYFLQKHSNYQTCCLEQKSFHDYFIAMLFSLLTFLTPNSQFSLQLPGKQ